MRTPTRPENEASAPLANIHSGAALEAFGISKAFGATVALESVDFVAHAGAVNVLLGENGAGKSTLMKILSGEELPDSGRIIRRGREVRLRSPRDAKSHGIALIHQELSLFPDLTVAENIFAGNERRRGFLVDMGRQRREAAAALEKLGSKIDPTRRVGSLAIGEQQVVEIAKAVSREARIIIMDEPTSSLSEAEVEGLFRLIKRLKHEGVAIVYISHRMGEIFKVADNITVLRDGRVAAVAEAETVDLHWIYDAMLGLKQRDALRRARSKSTKPALSVRPEPSLQIENLVVVDGANGRRILDGLSLSVRPREILGVYGLLGAGKTELAQSIMGTRAYSGSIRLAGKPLPKGTADRVAVGIALVPEDRRRDGLVPAMSVADNVLLSSFARVANGWLISRHRARLAVNAQVSALSIRARDASVLVSALSGGNQQKTILARAILTRPRVLILDEPTRGIDVGAKAEVYEIVADIAESGVAVLIVSSELTELLWSTDRILVLSRGRVRAEFVSAEASEGDVAAAVS